MQLHRPSEKVRRELFAEEILPEVGWNNWHFATFDVECFMHDISTDMEAGSIHRLVSIAVKSSFGTEKEFYIERADMDPISVKHVIQEFLSTLIYLRGAMLKEIPESIIEGYERYERIVRSKNFRKRSVAKQAAARNKRNFLEKCLALRIYSWNGERYDHNVIWAPLLDILANMERDFEKWSIIRRGTGIMQLSDGQLVFRDFLNMTSPMTLDRFARSCGVTATAKTTFPYEYFRDIESLKNVTEFPAYECFRSSLCQDTDGFPNELEVLVTKNIVLGIWGSCDQANEVFQFDPPLRFTEQNRIHPDDLDRAKILLHTSPEKYFTSKQIFLKECGTMSDYLRLSNLNDVILLEECIRAYAHGFHESWNVNIHEQMSLPGVAQDLAFRFYKENSTAIYTFGNSFKEFNTQIRQQLLGGMTLVTSFQIKI